MRVLVCATLTGLLCVLCGSVGASVTLVDQMRRVQASVEGDYAIDPPGYPNPTPPLGPFSDLQETSSPGFDVFDAAAVTQIPAIGTPWADVDATQSSSMSPSAISFTGTARSQPISGNAVFDSPYFEFWDLGDGAAESSLLVEFTVDAPTPFELTATLPVSAYVPPGVALPAAVASVRLIGPGSTLIEVLGPVDCVVGSNSASCPPTEQIRTGELSMTGTHQLEIILSSSGEGGAPTIGGPDSSWGVASATVDLTLAPPAVPTFGAPGLVLLSGWLGCVGLREAVSLRRPR